MYRGVFYEKSVLVIIVLITGCGILFGFYSYSAQKAADEKINEIIANNDGDMYFMDGEYEEHDGNIFYKMLVLDFIDEDNVDGNYYFLCYNKNGEPVYSEFLGGEFGTETYSLKKDVFGNVLLKESNNCTFEKLKIETNERNEIIGLYYDNHKSHWRFEPAQEKYIEDLNDNLVYRAKNS